MPDFNQMQRRRLAAKRQAMPDGGFPIRNVADLKNAIQAFGRAKNKPAVKAWIKKRARELGATNLLPDSWRDDVLVHYGVKGMKWGVRRTPEQLGHKIRQVRNMSDSDRTRYAKQRIKERGAEQAISDEEKKRKIQSLIVSGATKVSHLGLGGLAMGSFLTGNIPLAAASAAGWLAGVGGGEIAYKRINSNANKNIQEIARVSGLDKKKRKRSSGSNNSRYSDSFYAMERARMFNEQAARDHNMFMQQHMDDVNRHITMSTSMHMF